MGGDIDFNEMANKMIDDLPKEQREKIKRGEMPDVKSLMSGDSSKIQMVLNMLPKKAKALIGVVLVFVIYGLVSSVLDLISLISWLCG